MKKYLIIISLLSSGISFAQTNTFPPNGNAGIGTLEPAFMFTLKRMVNDGDLIHILRSDNTPNLDVYSNYSGLSDIQSGSFGYGVRPSDDAWQIWERGQNLSWTNLFAVKKDGNVGIGTANPGFKLDVQGGAVNVNLDNISALGGQLTISNSYGNQNGSVRLNFNNGGAVSWIKGLVTGPNTNTGSAIVFGVPSETSDGIERMRITSSGDVGIGTDNPKGYKLAVNGKIRTQEIKVENNNWPDFVFAKGYRLLPLLDTEKYIKEKGHLPGIPSATEVKVNGIDLGEINAKLLQKIEELTLHLIEKEKDLIKEQLINRDHEERLKKLETLIKRNNYK